MVSAKPEHQAIAQMRDFSIAYPTGTYYLENVVLAVRLDYLVVQLNERLFAGYKGWYLKSCSFYGSLYKTSECV